MLTYLSSVSRQEEACGWPHESQLSPETLVHAKRGRSREEISQSRTVRNPPQAQNNSQAEKRSTAEDTFSDRDIRVFLSAK
jgi:hypothetical protein